MNDTALPVKPLAGGRGGMRIAIVTETYPPEINGVAMTIGRILDGLLRRGHHIQLVRPRQHSQDSASAAPQFREVLVRGEKLLIPEHEGERLASEQPQVVRSRMRSLGCTHCSGAIRSTADSVAGIIDELKTIRRSERENRLIDHDQEGSMELKKREGYF